MSTQSEGDIGTPADQPLSPLDTALGVGGAIAGACLGYLLFRAMAWQGFYTIVLPGAFAGIGCGSLSRGKSLPLGIAYALLGLAAGIVAEWRLAPFIQDNSLLFFLSHIHKISPVSQVLILLGAFLAFWFGRGRTGGAWLRKYPHQSRK